MLPCKKWLVDRFDSVSATLRPKYVRRARSELTDFPARETIVGWDGPLDPNNPKNWPLLRKIITTILISICTVSVYMGAVIVNPASSQMQEHFNTTRTKWLLGISLFVWGYGLGSLWFTPMSELSLFRGRNTIYYGCQLMFALLQIPTALTNHLVSYLVLRLLAGIFASPLLSTVGATIGDIWAMPNRIRALVLWAYGTVAAPSIGVLIGTGICLHRDFRHIFWFMLALSGGAGILILILLHETSEQELLIRKAKNLRMATGRYDYVAPGELIALNQSSGALLREILLKPVVMTVSDPFLLLINIHTGLVYATLYLFVEALPMVYFEVYEFTAIQLGLASLPFLVGAALAIVLYLGYVFRCIDELDRPENILSRSATFGSCVLPIGLLLWGWLSTNGVHWAAGMVGSALFALAAFFMFQSYFALLSVLYPPETLGSAYASNNLVRSLMGGAAVLLGHSLFVNTAIEEYPVGWGATILAFIGMALIPLPVFLLFKGSTVQKRNMAFYGRGIGKE